MPQFKSEIVLSFPMVNGGHAFAVWLRDKLMKRLGLSDPLAVYLDSIASQVLSMPDGSQPQPEIDLRQKIQVPRPGVPSDPNRKELTLETLTKRTWQQKPVRGEDDIYAYKDYDNPFPFGVRRPDWDKNFSHAMRTARAVVFVLNDDFQASDWCRKEMLQAQTENTRRESLGQKLQLKEPLKLVVIDFRATPNNARISARHTTYVDATAVRGVGDKQILADEPLLYAPRQWKIDEEALTKIVQAISASSSIRETVRRIRVVQSM